MASELVREWRMFRDDRPGERFANHHERMRQEGTRAGAIARLAVGVLLVVGGVVLLFVPGPGLLVVLFGLGLLGGQSEWLARKLDRVEPPLRRGGRRVKRAWQRRSRATQVGLAAMAGVFGVVAGYGVWRWIT